MNEIWTTQDQYYTYIKKIADNIFKDSNIIYEILIFGVKYHDRNQCSVILYPDNKNNIILSEMIKKKLMSSNKGIKKGVIPEKRSTNLDSNDISHRAMINSFLNAKKKFNLQNKNIKYRRKYNLDTYKLFNKNNKCFAYFSQVRDILGYDVYIIFNLDKKSSSNYHKFHDPREVGRGEIRSFIDAVIYSYLNKCVSVLESLFKDEIVYKNNEIISISNKILISSGESLLKGVIEILDIDKKDDEVQIDMFDLINSISQMSYENTYINGYLVLINDDKLKNMQYIFKLKDHKDYRINKSKTTRKLIQMARNNIVLATDSIFIYGLYYKNIIEQLKDVFIIKIIGQSKWELYYNKWMLMYVEYSIPRIITGINQDEIRNRIINAEFRQEYIDDIHRFILDVIEVALKERKGITLIFGNDVQEEIANNNIVCIKIEVRSIRDIFKSINSLLTIDGGILMDKEGRCYAIGAILQYGSSEQNDPARGSRYHAAKAYSEKAKEKNSRFVVVISEDGYIDFFPEPEK